jgi:hypothetical protein
MTKDEICSASSSVTEDAEDILFTAHNIALLAEKVEGHDTLLAGAIQRLAWSIKDRAKNIDLKTGEVFDAHHPAAIARRSEAAQAISNSIQVLS